MNLIEKSNLWANMFHVYLNETIGEKIGVAFCVNDFNDVDVQILDEEQFISELMEFANNKLKSNDYNDEK